jgi:P-type E1-E2 ATPase
MQDRGPHGFSEVLYAYSSQGNNNGSAFAGYNANIPFVNVTGGYASVVPAEVRVIVDRVAKEGATPLVVVDGARVLGVIQPKDIVKGGIRERFAQLRRMGIKTVMITGDTL